MNKRIASFTLVIATIIATAAGTSACGRGKGNDNVPDAETFYMALPETQGDDAGSSASQAACVSTEGYDALKERILVYNVAIQDRIALIKLMLKAANKAGGASFTRSASKNDFTVTLT